MIPLKGTCESHRLPASSASRIFQLFESTDGDTHERGVLIARGYLAGQPLDEQVTLVKTGAVFEFGDEPWCVLPPELGHLQPGDIIAIDSQRAKVRVLWRVHSGQNFMLLTERCDNYCLMCSQPPRDRNDRWLLDQAFEVAHLIPSTAANVVLTGGEPTVYGDELVDLICEIRASAADCHVHLLSNGRRFSNIGFAQSFAASTDDKVMVAIPLYGAEQRTHDYVVQASGAFDETIRGVLNLAALGQRIELRVVLHALTIEVLIDLAEYVIRNLPFVDHVALMGLELTGLTRTNLEELWIDPYDYRKTLAAAASMLNSAGIPTSIYNLPLCLLEPRVRNLAVQSISDWKNEYEPACSRCAVAAQCAGFFHSASLRQSAHIRPLDNLEQALDEDSTAAFGLERTRAGTPVSLSSRRRASPTG